MVEWVMQEKFNDFKINFLKKEYWIQKNRGFAKEQ